MLLADDGAQIAALHGRLQARSNRPRPNRPSCRTPTFSSWNRTFGRPQYRLPPRASTVAQLLEIVHAALADGKTPVIHAYPLGKSQEVTKLLTRQRRAGAAASGRLRDQPHLRKVRRRSGRLRAVRRPAARRPRRRHAAADCEAVSLAGSWAARSRSPSPVGPPTRARSIAWASIMRCRSPTTPITTS